MRKTEGFFAYASLFDESHVEVPGWPQKACSSLRLNIEDTSHSAFSVLVCLRSEKPTRFHTQMMACIVHIDNYSFESFPLHACNAYIKAASHSAISEFPVLPMCEHQSLPLTHSTFLGWHHLVLVDHTY